MASRSRLQKEITELQKNPHVQVLQSKLCKNVHCRNDC